MKLLLIIILSIIQGISEILPISSSGHLILFKYLFKIDSDSLTLEIFLHLGSLIAVIIYYFNDLKDLLINSIKYFKNKDNQNYQNSLKFVLKLMVSTLITGTGGILLSEIVNDELSQIKFLPFFFLLTSLILFITSKIKTNKNLNQLTYKDSIVIGLFQLIGIIPGISRSGITITGCKISKLEDESSFKYSYLLFIPITFASFILELFKLISGKIELSLPAYYYIIGIIVSLVFTLLSINFFSKIIKKGKLYFFSYYLIVISLFTLITYLYL